MRRCPAALPSIGAGLGVEDGWERRAAGLEEGMALPCPAPSKPAARAKSELMDPCVIGNWVSPWDYEI